MWLVTFFYDGIQAQSKIKLLGRLANPILILCILGKLSQEFPKNLGTLRNNYFMPKLLVTYGTWYVGGQRTGSEGKM